MEILTQLPYIKMEDILTTFQPKLDKGELDEKACFFYLAFAGKLVASGDERPLFRRIDSDKLIASNKDIENTFRLTRRQREAVTKALSGFLEVLPQKGGKNVYHFKTGVYFGYRYVVTDEKKSPTQHPNPIQYNGQTISYPKPTEQNEPDYTGEDPVHPKAEPIQTPCTPGPINMYRAHAGVFKSPKKTKEPQLASGGGKTCNYGEGEIKLAKEYVELLCRNGVAVRNFTVYLKEVCERNEHYQTWDKLEQRTEKLRHGLSQKTGLRELSQDKFEKSYTAVSRSNHEHENYDTLIKALPKDEHHKLERHAAERLCELNDCFSQELEDYKPGAKLSDMTKKCLLSEMIEIFITKNQVTLK